MKRSRAAQPQEIDNLQAVRTRRSNRACLGAASPLIISDIALVRRSKLRLQGVLVYCVSRQHHSGRLNLADLLNWDWYDISAHLK